MSVIRSKCQAAGCPGTVVYELATGGQQRDWWPYTEGDEQLIGADALDEALTGQCPVCGQWWQLHAGQAEPVEPPAGGEESG